MTSLQTQANNAGCILLIGLAIGCVFVCLFGSLAGALIRGAL
jgi:hypothetical protein